MLHGDATHESRRRRRAIAAIATEAIIPVMQIS
jgi:hypothetical protein